jgi:hypothetical protein
MLITRTPAVLPEDAFQWVLLAGVLVRHPKVRSARDELKNQTCGLTAQLTQVCCLVRRTGLQATISMYSGVRHISSDLERCRSAEDQMINMTMLQWAVCRNHLNSIASIGMGIVAIAGLVATVSSVDPL